MAWVQVLAGCEISTDGGSLVLRFNASLLRGESVLFNSSNNVAKEDTALCVKSNHPRPSRNSSGGHNCITLSSPQHPTNVSLVWFGLVWFGFWFGLVCLALPCRYVLINETGFGDEWARTIEANHEPPPCRGGDCPDQMHGRCVACFPWPGNKGCCDTGTHATMPAALVHPA